VRIERFSTTRKKVSTIMTTHHSKKYRYTGNIGDETGWTDRWRQASLVLDHDETGIPEMSGQVMARGGGQA
jgi:hypothetical protein